MRWRGLAEAVQRKPTESGERGRCLGRLCGAAFQGCACVVKHFQEGLGRGSRVKSVG
jgi:hypothetical protein